jgi:origin recognition complex subunit 5
MQAAATDLFKLYVQPLCEGRQMQSQQLYARIRGEVQERVAQLQLQARHAMRQHFDAGHSLVVAADGDAVAAGRTGNGRADGDRSSSEGLSFELPYMSKFLLLAAYVASRNKPTADRAVFDPTHSKRARRDAQAHDRQVEPWSAWCTTGGHQMPRCLCTCLPTCISAACPAPV